MKLKTDFLKRISAALMQPVVSQWPLLLAYIVLVGWSSLLQNPFYRWFIIFLHAYIVASVVHLTKSKLLKGFFYVVCFTLYFIEAMLESCYGLAISPGTLALLVETNPQETQEFFGTVMLKPAFWATLLAGIAFIVLAVWAERRRLRVAERLQRPKPYRVLRIVAMLFLLIGLIGSECYVKLFQCKSIDEVSAWNRHMRYPSDAMTRVVIAFFDTHLAKDEMDIAIAQTLDVAKQTIKSDKGPVNVVFVIGESYIRQHASVYGYPMNTTPFMKQEQQEGRLVVFTDAVAPYNLTTLVVRNIVSTNSMASGQRWSQRPPLTAVFKQAGFYVTMYDNQRIYSFASTQTFALNNYLYHPQVLKACYDETNDQGFEFDGQLVDDYAKKRHPKNVSRLAIFHLMGQHNQFELRYPNRDTRFARFTADSIGWRKEPWMTDRKRLEIARYDNATLYNDYVVSQIAELYKDEPTVVVYLSDHGEEVYDYRDNIGRSLADNLPEMLSHQYGVPLVVWCSDKYRELHPDVMARLQQAKDRPLMTDNVCQLLFRLGGLTKQPYYVAQRDVLSDDYACGRRLLNDRWDYDDIRNKRK